jgi:hypothetical protein
VVVTTAAGLVLWQFDPHRIHRLTGALLHPVAFLAPHLHQNPGTGPLGHRPGGPPGLRLEWLPCLVGCAVSLMTIGTIWLRHKDLDLAICCVMGACALCGLVLTGPWVTGDMTMRFALNAVIPLTICGAFCSDQIPANWRATPAAMVALLVIAPSVPLLKHGGEPAISMQALAELRLMTGEIDAAPHSLVVARHGLEWWASWILGTHISQPGALRANDWGTYQNVYVLHLKGLMTMPGPPPSAPPPSADDPMNLGRGPGGDAHGPFRELPIPTSATIVHDGPCFTLARIPGPIPLP